MFGIEYLIGLIVVLVNLGMAIMWAIPVNFIYSRIGTLYFPFLPEYVPYWHIVGLTFLVSFVGHLISEVSPLKGGTVGAVTNTIKNTVTENLEKKASKND